MVTVPAKHTENIDRPNHSALAFPRSSSYSYSTFSIVRLKAINFMSAFTLKQMHSVTYIQTKMFWQCNENKRD